MALVSVITPTYNRGDKISCAIESVLEQTYDDFEHLIVDDASTDNTKEVVEGFGDSRIRYIRHENNKRQAAARNTALGIAEGKYVAFLDSDDEWHPNKLEEQVKWFKGRGKNWVGVYCDGRTNRDSWLKEMVTSLFPYEIRKNGQQDLIRDILTMQGNISAGSSLMVQTEIAREIGGFDESLPRHEDLDFTIRILKQGKLGYIDKELFIVHESGDPSSELMARSKQRYLDNFSEEIERLEAEGYPVRRFHEFHLARAYISGGSFRKGFQHLKGSKASNPRQYLRILVALIQGVKKSVMNKIRLD